MNHPKNKAERRRINFKKKHHDEDIQAKVSREEAETRKALEALRIHGVELEQDDATWHCQFMAVCYFYD